MLSCSLMSESTRTIAPQAPVSIGSPREAYWNGCNFLVQGNLPDPGFESMSSALAGRFFTTEPPGKP